MRKPVILVALFLALAKPSSTSLDSLAVSNAGLFSRGHANLYDQSLIHSCDPQTEFSAVQGARYVTDAITGCIAEPPGASITNANAFAGYANTSANSSGRALANAVALYGQCRVLVNTGSCWGQNTVTQDLPPLGGGRLKGNYAMTGVETDINFWGTPSFMTGVLVTGNWEGKFPAGSSAFGVAHGEGSTQSWPFGYACGYGVNACFKSLAVAFSTLAGCNGGTEGAMQAVTDSKTDTWGATISGGGSHHVLAYCDGTNWTVLAR